MPVCKFFRAKDNMKSFTIHPFMHQSRPLCRIPEIDDGFIPQGVAYDPAEEKLLITGYMIGPVNSPIYVVDQKNRTEKKILMQTEEGRRFGGHAGGISIYRGTAYVAGSTAGFMYGFPLHSLYAAPDQSPVPAAEKIDLTSPFDRIRVSFTAADDELLYAGEFHRDPVFFTHPSHGVEIKGKNQKGYLFGFVPKADGSAEPVCVYSIPDQIQGACFGNGHLFLSKSHGFKPSKVLAYRLANLPVHEMREVLGKRIPLYLLTEKNASCIRQLPPMVEEMTTSDGRLIAIFEAASDLYRIGKKMGLDHVLTAPLSFFTG